MAGPGRPPLPQEVKLARGTFRADRAKTSSIPSIPLTSKPPAPESLGEVGRKKWTEWCDLLENLKLLESRYLDALEMYCRAWDRLDRYEKQLVDESGEYNEYVTAKGGYQVAHPAVGMARHAREEIRRYQTEFGFTPSSATGIATNPRKDKAGVPSRKKDVG